MKSTEVKNEILNGIFRSKDGLSSNELRELINTLIEVSKKEVIASRLESGIKTKALRNKITGEWFFFDGDWWDNGSMPIPYDGELEDVIDDLPDAELVDIIILQP